MNKHANGECEVNKVEYLWVYSEEILDISVTPAVPQIYTVVGELLIEHILDYYPEKEHQKAEINEKE